ncbi:MAG: tRNA dihydrouridine(20/20a) synthase DusA [Gammaproteobacteria bacterium]|nr:tRNA dihydrouridine(20/20a) synthase DusA [Gammaproteobacteria bacterium]MBT5203872.1 tRNA dihydrouridine(20/20a) synthase DusA [Gammaproteobacteria bacterium]MBT5602291.1 tRNA dihydrouridine(20/20a) synthase DusA [Gammaproteobacteria bacterium]MBT6244049.1 tRNA dihydrouridine(20/20a) synthase DusA [Gammaproteobacteria bacterium]
MPDRTLSVAPMMGCTDRHFRYLLRLMSPHAMLYTEMVTTGALTHGQADNFLAHHADEPVGLQVGGSDPEQLALSAKLCEQAGYQEINLNVGCPSDRVQTGGIGACLMATPALVATCFQAMQARVSIPVTIKSRIGIDDLDSYTHFSDFIGTLYTAGCRIFIVHARKAILSGLSPKDNREIPPLKYDYVYQIQKEFPEADFILNGGIKTTDHALAGLSKLPGVMLGRAIYQNPFLLGELESSIYTTAQPDKDAIIRRYRDYMASQLSQGTRLKYMTRHLLGLYLGQPGARAYRRFLSENMFAETAGIDVFDKACGYISSHHNERATLC